jgi:hypothetical protein
VGFLPVLAELDPADRSEGGTLWTSVP